MSTRVLSASSKSRSMPYTTRICARMWGSGMSLLYKAEFSMMGTIFPVMASKWKPDATPAVLDLPFERSSSEISFIKSFMYHDMTLIKMI